MVEYTIDDIRGPTVAREMAQLKEFVLARFNGAIADAEAAAAAAATAAANAVLANTVKKTGESSQSIAGDVAITGALDAAAIGSGSTPIVAGNLTAYGSVSLDDTVLQGNLSGADPSALINLSGVGSVLVPAPTANGEAATKKYVDDALDAYAPMVRTTGNQLNIAGDKGFLNSLTMLPRNIFNALGWTNIFNINANGIYAFVMFAGSNIILCHLDGHSAARALVIGNTARPYTDCIKIAHNQITDEYEVWFNAAYGAWARGFMISEGSAQSVGEPSHYVAKNIRSTEPTIGDTYDSIVTSVRWNVVP